MPVPVWAALLAVAVAKKAVVFTAAKVRQNRSTLQVVSLLVHLRLMVVDLWLPSLISEVTAAGAMGCT